jgi:hypothetical protein
MSRQPWFRSCTWYRQAPDASRKWVSPSTRSSYLRIARLPAAIGAALDGEVAPFRVYRFVAWGEGTPAVERRYRIARRLRRGRRRWPLDGEMYLALQAPPSSRAPPSGG